MGTTTANTRSPKTTNFPAWEYALLSKLGAPATPENLVGLNLWAKSEGVEATANNPLAITNPNQVFGSDAGTINTAGVAKFSSLGSGVDATANFLNAPGYSAIVAALKRGNSLNALYSAINNSGWCRGCQGGAYPSALAKYSTGPVNLSAIPIFHGGSPSGSAAVVGGKSESSSGFYQCNSATTIVGGLGFNVLNACEAKAIVGGLLMAAGIATMMVGGAILLRRPIRTGVGTALKFVPDPRAQAASNVVTPAPKPSAEERRAEGRRAWEAKYGRPWSESDAGRGNA